MNRADQTALALDFLNTTHQELPEAARLLDLAEDRFDGLLAQQVTTASSGSRQAGAHRGDAFTAACTLPDRGGFVVPLPTGRHIGADLVPGEHRQVTLRTIPPIGGQLSCLAARVDFDLLDDRGELLVSFR